LVLKKAGRWFADDMLGGHVDDMEADWSKPIVSIRCPLLSFCQFSFVNLFAEHKSLSRMFPILAEHQNNIAPLWVIQYIVDSR